MASLGFLAVGTNPTKIFGLAAAERMRRFATKAKLDAVDQVPAAGSLMVADRAFAWDPAWLAHVRDTPGLAVTIGGRAALAHLTGAGEAPALIAAIEAGAPLPPIGPNERRIEDGATLYNAQLRKREDGYLMPLTPATAPLIEKASYDASYKGVTDVLTLYLWRGAAFHLTRWAAYARITPNMITTVGALLCVAATLLFYRGWLWSGLAAGFVFMVLDTVDGKLARCTGTSSEIGNILDHGIDLVHPPFWYWAWGVGCAAYGVPLSAVSLWSIVALIVAFYVVQRLIEGAFIARFGIHIHVWERFDSRFRLVTARRNPNIILMVAALIAGRPDWGLVAVAIWTVISCLVHLVRLAQAMVRAGRGETIATWLA